MVYKVPREVAESLPECRLRQIMTSGQTWVRSHPPTTGPEESLATPIGHHLIIYSNFNDFTRAPFLYVNTKAVSTKYLFPTLKENGKCLLSSDQQ
jgi:hypothetical protein